MKVDGHQRIIGTLSEELRGELTGVAVAPAGFNAGAYGASVLTAPDISRVIVIGCAGHARVVLDILESDERCKIIGLLDTFRPITTSVCGYPVIGTDEELPALLQAQVCDSVFVAIGDNWVRNQVVQRIRRRVPEVRFLTVIHPSATVSRNVCIGDGTVIMAGVVVNSGCTIGEFCILNTCSSLDHDSTMRDFSSLAPRAVTGGNVHIGSFSAIAIGAVISHSRRIGEHTVIGAGATVVEDIPEQVVAYGVPARVIRRRNPGDVYLGERSPQSWGTGDLKPAISIVNPRNSLRIIPSNSSEWTECIERTAHDFFHRAEYHGFTESTQGGNGWLYVYGKPNKFLAWPMMIQEIESPASSPQKSLTDISSVYGYTGPVACACEDDQSFLLSAWREITAMWRSQGIVSVFTRFHPLLANHRLVPHLREVDVECYTTNDPHIEGATVAIDLRRTPEDIWESYNRRLRQALRHAESAGMTVTSDPEWRYLDDFIRLYHATMSRNHASPFYFFSAEYFAKLRATLSSQGSLLVTKVKGQVASVALLIEYASIVSVHLLASGEEFTDLSPSKHTIHEAGVWARSRGNRFLHIGGGRGSRTNDPLFRFKSRFSDQSYPFYTGRWILKPEAYETLTLQVKPQIPNAAEGPEAFFPEYRMPI